MEKWVNFKASWTKYLMIIYFEPLIKNMDAFSIIQFFMIKLFPNIQVPNQFKITPFNKRYSTYLFKMVELKKL